MKLLLLSHPFSDSFMQELDHLRMEHPDFEYLREKSSEERDQLLREAEGIVLGRLRSGDIEKAVKLRIIFVPWAGVNHLPWDIIQQRNIQVAHTHGNSEAVAEKAFALCLALLGHIVPYHNDLAQGIWHGFAAQQFDDRWQTLKNKSCGILGYGSIGKHLHQLLIPFKGPFHGLKNHLPDTLPEDLDSISQNIDEVIDKSQILFLTMPLTPRTRHIINRERLNRMNGKYLINVSRGELIEEEALFQALKEGVLAGAGLDVWFQYPTQRSIKKLPSQYPFHDLSNIVMSPHVGGFCEEGHQQMIQDTLQNIASWIKTGKPLIPANSELQY